MNKPSRLLRSKVAHRIVILFVSCALIPIGILAAIAFYEVSSQLREESTKLLARASKNQGMEIYERLEMLDSDLTVLSMELRDRRTLATGQVVPRHLQGLASFDFDGTEHAHWGNPPVFPPLTPEQKDHLRSGNSLIRTGLCGSGTSECISMVRMSDAGRSGSSMLVGEVNPEFLWVPKAMPQGLGFCVLSAARSILFCSEGRTRAGTNRLSNFNHASGFYQWQENEKLYDAAYWKLLMRPTFLQQPWTIVVDQEHADALAPMLRFRRSFPLVILLIVWIVLLFSMAQVRRTLVPLQKLQEGTRKIGAAQFESRVDVHSGDEFEGLAESFNSMTAQLGRQFHTLKTLNEIDQAIFASLDVDAIVDGVFARMPNLLACDCFGVLIVGTSRSTLRVQFPSREQVRTESIEVNPAALMQLSNVQDAVQVTGEERIPDYLAPLCDAGMRSFLVLPIRVDHSLQAALVFANERKDPVVPEDVLVARQVADQLAVAFSHVQLIKALEELHRGTLTALARAIDAKSEWTAGHSERVTYLSLEIGRQMGFTAQNLEIMRMGGLLHDIGKIGTPPTILDKPASLTADEMAIMKDHVRTGVRILEPIAAFREALPIVAQHHEWFNGKGYPEGLAGDDISLFARIFAVADCYDALTSDRPYRKGLTPQRTIAMLQQKSGEQFDPQVIDAFTRLMVEKMSDDDALLAAVATGGAGEGGQ